MITALAGGTGAAKFLRGLVRLIEPDQLTVIGNTGDDIDLWGLRISPDLDTVTYTLAGLIDDTKGWGVSDDSFQCLRAMASLGRETWFTLGDRDLATHLVRTESLSRGLPLSTVTDAIRRDLGVRCRILPMSDLPVRTKILTPGGWLTFQEFFVREKAQVEILDTVYEGAEAARPAPGVLEAIREARAVVLCPSNPITSIGPILAVPGVTEALAETPATVVAVSPIVAGAAVSGPAGALMAAKGLPVSAAGVARAYQGWLDVLILDRRDQGLAPELLGLGVSPAVADTLMSDRGREVDLARAVLRAIG
ncbi:MAG: 2-phospho-L-lactate transferase [Candidatus Methylomirabilia bacterium]